MQAATSSTQTPWTWRAHVDAKQRLELEAYPIDALLAMCGVPATGRAGASELPHALGLIDRCFASWIAQLNEQAAGKVPGDKTFAPVFERQRRACDGLRQVRQHLCELELAAAALPV